MSEERANARSAIEECVSKLKAMIPTPEHAALDLRAEELMNDASADDQDVVSILRQEFDPEHNAGE